ncbi:MAG TPA: helix-turn-helix domain-containing protein [Planctomycetota bacterium]|nr:helix-turn-helix domain-containing protein [Planctomycetota bacterium]HRR81095.1 helix-turn-helix domain-containing protein [Planctomycetota bacterium]HRT93471.1 helix-turn-helix domain-containing protein [Planctomycetota bacterium]
MEFLRAAVVARALDVSAMTVRRMCARGDLRAIKVGSTWRISHYGEGGIHEYLARAADE